MITVSSSKTLLIRIDRMGDLILTLPVDQLPVLKNHECHWLINEGLEFIPQSSNPPRKFKTISRTFSWGHLKKAIAIIKQINPQQSVSFHAPWWINLALFIAKVPIRIGVKSQWHSFLFLNKGIRQKRSESTLNEFEYNAELVLKGLDVSNFDIKQQTQNIHLQLLSPKSFINIKLPVSEYIVVHPGMGGSALNISTQKYVSIISELSNEFAVVITGTIVDRKFIDPIKKMLSKNQNVFWLNEQLTQKELLTVLAQAKGFIGPSTGVTHLSSALGVPTVGIYPPVKVMSATRWSPRGNKTTTVSPEVMCPGHFKCLGAACSQHPCMEKVTSQNIIFKLKQLMY